MTFLQRAFELSILGFSVLIAIDLGIWGLGAEVRLRAFSIAGRVGPFYVVVE